MNSTYSDKVIKSLALKYRLPEPVIRKIVRYQFQFVRDKMAEGVKGDYSTFPTIRLLNLGTFIPKKRKIEYMGDGIRYEEIKRSVYKKKYGTDFDESSDKRLNKDSDGTVHSEE